MCSTVAPNAATPYQRQRTGSSRLIADTHSTVSHTAAAIDSA